MANQLYKEHLVVWSADYKSDNESWIAIVNISWRKDGIFQFHRFIGPARLSQEEAMAEGLTLAKLWIDRKL